MRNIIILMLFLASSVFASENDYFFVVENATMVDAYFNVFNAMASIFSSDSYYDILKLAFLVGGFFIFAGGILSLVASGGASSGATTLTSFAKYYLTATALLVLLFSVKSTMWVSTNNIPTFCTVTDPGSATTGQAIRMPSVLAFVFSSTNLLGRELTNLAESAFSSASGAPTMVNQGGFAGGVKNTLKILLHESDSDVDFKTGWQLFFSKCVYEVANNKGQEGIDRVSGASGVTGMHGEVGLERSKDLASWSVQYLNTPFTGTTRKPGESLVDIGGKTMTCQNLYDTTLAPSMAMLKAGVGCGLKEVNADTLKLIMGYTAGPGVSDLQTIALQAGLVGSLSESKKMSSIGVQAGYASGKTMGETNINNLNTANYMAEMLPYVQMTMRAILYAFFPFVFVVVILPGGLAVLKSYGQTLAWIELWGPTAAVVNMFVNLQAESKVSGTYTQEGLTMLTSVDMVSEANNIAGIAAMLYLAIPALTWLILKGSGQMLGNFTSGMSAGFTKNLQADAINKDVSGHRTAEEATRQNKENGLNKVVSFGEAQHYAAKTMGVNAGATMSAQMINGLDSVGDSAFQKSGSDYRGASLKKELLGSNSMVIETAAVNEAVSSKSKAVEQRLTGATGVDGKVNMGGASSVATTTGVASARNTLESKVQNETNGIIKNGVVNESALENTTKPVGELKAADDITKQKLVENLGPDAVNKISTTNAVTQVGQTIAAESKQKETGEQNPDGSINGAKTLEVNKDVGVKNAFDIEKSRTELKRMEVIKEDGTVDKAKFKEWSDAMGGQAYLQANTAKMTTEKIQEHFNLGSRKEAENLQASIGGEKGYREQVITGEVQKNVSAEKEIGAKSVGEETKILTDSKAQDLTGQTVDGKRSEEGIKKVANVQSIDNASDFYENKAKQEFYREKEQSDQSLAKEIGDKEGLVKGSNSQKAYQTFQNQSEMYGQTREEMREKIIPTVQKELQKMDAKGEEMKIQELNKLLKKEGGNMDEVNMALEYNDLHKNFAPNSTDLHEAKQAFMKKYEGKLDTNHGALGIGSERLSNEQMKKFDTSLQAYDKLKDKAVEISKGVDTKIDQEKGKYLEGLEKAGLITLSSTDAKNANVMHNDGKSVNTGEGSGKVEIKRNDATLAELSDKEMAKKLANSFTLTSASGQSTSVTKNEFNEITGDLRRTANGEVDEAYYGANTNELARRAGVSKDILYAINTTGNGIDTVLKNVNRVGKVGNLVKKEDGKLPDFPELKSGPTPISPNKNGGLGTFP